jgi:hypothetical protein
VTSSFELQNVTIINSKPHGLIHQLLVLMKQYFASQVSIIMKQHFAFELPNHH